MVTPMLEIFEIVAHLLATVVRVAVPGGVRAVIVESLLLKHQLLVLSCIPCAHRVPTAGSGRSVANPEPQFSVAARALRSYFNSEATRTRSHAMKVVQQGFLVGKCAWLRTCIYLLSAARPVHPCSAA